MLQRCPEGAIPTPPLPKFVCSSLPCTHSRTSRPPEPRLQWRFIIWMLRNGRGEQFPLPRGQPRRKSWNTHCTSAAAARGECDGMSFAGTVPGAGVPLSPASVYKNNGLQMGKLRPRAAKDLLYTSKSKSFLATELGLEWRIYLGQSSVLLPGPGSSSSRPLLQISAPLLLGPGSVLPPHPATATPPRGRALWLLGSRNNSYFLGPHFLKVSISYLQQ